jgi:hypothetical protein
MKTWKKPSCGNGITADRSAEIILSWAFSPRPRPTSFRWRKEVGKKRRPKASVNHVGFTAENSRLCHESYVVHGFGQHSHFSLSGPGYGMGD